MAKIIFNSCIQESAELKMKNLLALITFVYHYTVLTALPHTENELTANLTKDKQMHNLQEYATDEEKIFYVVSTPCKKRNIVVPSCYTIISGIGALKFQSIYKKTWNEARKSCISDGGNLIVFNSENEFSLVKKYLTDHDISDMWIGIHELFQNGDWVTIWNEPMERYCVMKWQENEPNGYNNNEHCASIKKEGMNDADCALKKPYICKIYLEDPNLNNE